MACRGRVVSLVVASVVAAASTAALQGPVSAQAGPEARVPSRVGGVVGFNRTEQRWSPSTASEPVVGFIAGGFVDARTPVKGFTILAEGSYTQRGGDVRDVGTASVEGGVRTDYLSVSVRPKLALRAGPVRLHVAGGPAFENVLRSRVAPGFQDTLEREGRSVFGVLLGAGLEVGVGDGRFVGIEARRFEGLGDAYSGNFISVRNRSWEAVVRFGMPIRR